MISPGKVWIGVQWIAILGGVGLLAYGLTKGWSAVGDLLNKAAAKVALASTGYFLLSDNYEVPGTGLTVAELRANGLSDEEIYSLYKQGTGGSVIGNILTGNPNLPAQQLPADDYYIAAVGMTVGQMRAAGYTSDQILLAVSQDAAPAPQGA